MRLLSSGLIAAALTLPFASPLGAQAKAPEGETITVSARIIELRFDERMGKLL